ncbi:reverse transcriptase domain-containing protein [Tanacetum coccineum]
MLPRMRTRSAGRPVAESRGGGMGGWVSRDGERGRGPRGGNDEHVKELNGQWNRQGVGANRGIEGVKGNVEGVNGGANDFSTIIAQQLQNLLPAILAQVGNQGNVGNQNGCSYKEFLACNPKEYDGKGGDVVLNRWIEKIESVQDMSGCSIDQKVKYATGSLVGKALTWWNSQIRTFSWEVVVSMSWNDFKFMMIEEFCPSHEMQKLETKLWNHPWSRLAMLRILIGFMSWLGEFLTYALTHQAVRNGSIKKIEKRGNVGEPRKDTNGRDDNNKTRTGNAFATTANPVGRENTGAWPKCTTCNSDHELRGPCRTRDDIK